MAVSEPSPRLSAPSQNNGQPDFDQLFERYYPAVVGFFTRRGYSVEDSRDLAQDTFLRAHGGIGRFRGEASIESWLFTIAANVWRSSLRDRATGMRQAKEVSLDATEEFDLALPEVHGDIALSGAGGALADYLEKERLGRLRQELAELPTQMRRCLLLRLDQQLKYREIAKILKISIQTVKATLFQARERLKHELASHYPEIEF